MSVVTKRPFFKVVDGVQRCPNLSIDIFEENKHFKARDGDIVQCSYPMCGTYWMNYITILILRRGEPLSCANELNRCVRSIDHVKNVHLWEPDLLPKRMLITRVALRPEAINPAAKYICIPRNPWDVGVSFYHRATDLSPYRFQDGTFDEFFESFMEDSFGLRGYIDVVRAGYALRKEPNVFFVTYEELKTDTRGVVLRLAGFLGPTYREDLENDESLLQKIVNLSSAEVMRDLMVVGMRQKEGGDIVNSRSGYKGDNKKFSVGRRAAVGQWKEYLTPEKLARIEAKIEEAGEEASFIQLWNGIRAEAFAASKHSFDYACC
ncbi:sulfotransferase 2A8-like [Haemaphysalis longicornis]